VNSRLLRNNSVRTQLPEPFCLVDLLGQVLGEVFFFVVDQVREFLLVCTQIFTQFLQVSVLTHICCFKFNLRHFQEVDGFGVTVAWVFVAVLRRVVAFFTLAGFGLSFKCEGKPTDIKSEILTKVKCGNRLFLDLVECFGLVLVSVFV